jgi:hypothetical protein
LELLNAGIESDLPSTIERAFERDQPKAMAEYGTDGFVQFRSDVEEFISLPPCVLSRPWAP